MLGKSSCVEIQARRETMAKWIEIQVIEHETWKADRPPPKPIPGAKVTRYAAMFQDVPATFEELEKALACKGIVLEAQA